MRKDIQNLKKDMADVRATERSIAVALTRIEGKVDQLLGDVATKTQLGDLIGRVDSFCGIVESSRDERKIFDTSFSEIRATLQDHEARLIRLTPRKDS